MLTTYKTSKDNRQLFNDGSLIGISVAGAHILANLTRPIPFGYKVIGIKRFYHAMGEKINISKLVVVPYDNSLIDIGKVELSDYRTGSKKIYKVIQFQELPDSAPPAMQLTLAELETKFEDDRL